MADPSSDEGLQKVSRAGCVLSAIAIPLFGAVMVIIVFGNLLSGCDYRWESDRVGLTANPDGTVQATIPACTGQDVHVISLYSGTNASNWQPLWTAQAAGSQHLETFTVGIAPSGFADLRSFNGSWPNGPLYLSVNGSSNPDAIAQSFAEIGEGSTDASIAFQYSDVHPGDVLINEKHVTADRVEALGCPPPRK